MKRSRHTEEQISFALKQAELGTSVPEVCRKIGVSDATFYNWRKKYGGFGTKPKGRNHAFSHKVDRFNAWSRPN